jgi:uncharacterized protein YjbK
MKNLYLQCTLEAPLTTSFRLLEVRSHLSYWQAIRMLVETESPEANFQMTLIQNGMSLRRLQQLFSVTFVRFRQTSHTQDTMMLLLSSSSPVRLQHLMA